MESDGGQDNAQIMPDAFLDQVVEFPDGTQFERIHPITDYRRDPGEARILYICKRAQANPGSATGDTGREFVMKIKVQYVDNPRIQDLAAKSSQY